MYETFYSWFTAAPGLYWWLSIPTGLTLLAAALRAHQFSNRVFLTVLAVTLLAFRWPAVVFGVELNPDESQALAAALTLQVDPIHWSAADAHAIGPASIYPLALVGSVGVPLTFALARLLGLAMAFAALAALYALLRDAFPERTARAAVLPPAAFLALTRDVDFLHYSSEQMPVGLLMVGAAAVWTGISRGSTERLALGAAALGAVGWAKLQALPMALLLLGALAVRQWQKGGESPGQRRKGLTWLAGGAILPTAVVAGLLTAGGVWGECHRSYVRAGLDYLQAGDPALLAVLGRLLAQGQTGFPAFALPLAVVGALLGGPALFRGPRRDPQRSLCLLLGATTALALWAAASPGRVFPHYLYLVVFPLAGFSAAVFGRFVETAAASPRRAGRPWQVDAAHVVFLAVTLLPLVHFATAAPGLRYDFPAGVHRLIKGEAAQTIAELTESGDTMAVWGWRPSLHVQTGLPQATREAHSERQIRPFGMRDTFRARYLADLQQTRPQVFVDSVGPRDYAFDDRPATGHEAWPELAHWISEHYRLVGEFEGARVYARVE